MKNFDLVSKLTGFLLCTGIFLLSGCSKEDIGPVDQNNAPDIQDLKTAIEITAPVQLEGYTRFAIYSVNEHRYLTTGYDFNFCWCEAELIPVGKHDFILNTAEYFIGDPVPFRTGSLEGHISSSGQIKYTWEGIVSDIQAHVGITPHGPGAHEGSIVYYGTFDGETLDAEMHLSGLQTQPAMYPFFWKNPDDPTELFQGPLKLNFMFQLEVVD